MERKKRSAVATLTFSTILSANAHGQRLPPELAVANPVVYDVTISTTFTVPENGKKLTRLAVWHALPNARPWDGLDRTLGASATTYRPRDRPCRTPRGQGVAARVMGVPPEARDRKEVRVRESFSSSFGGSYVRSRNGLTQGGPTMGSTMIEVLGSRRRPLSSSPPSPTRSRKKIPRRSGAGILQVDHRAHPVRRLGTLLSRRSGRDLEA